MARLIRAAGLTRLGWAVLFLTAIGAGLVVGLLVPGRAGAQEGERSEATSRGGHRAAMRELALERAAAHGANGAVVWRVVSECEVPSLDPHARGDGGHSHGLAQLGDQQWTGNLLGHFYSLGYSDWSDPTQAWDYMARAFAGEFRRSSWGDIGPHRWTCWRLMYGS